jgi:heat-inducible transcriptional repressor
MADERVTARQRAILMTIVERYIATGEPVGSGTIAAALGAVNLSPATVRNEMADLADAGLLEQPHTSAGRIPTAQAFRMYVEQIRGDGRGLVGLSAVSRSQIDRKFAGVAGTSEVLERTSHVLATLSSGVGLAVTAASGLVDTLEHIHFSRLASARVLAVVVTQSGQVRDRVLALEKDLSSLALETAARFLNESFRGWSMEAVRAELTRLVEGERNEYLRMLEARQLWAKAVPEGSAGVAQTVYVEGVANLIGGQDGARLRDLLSALEAKQRLVELLNAYIDARQESVRVVFDLEEQAPEMAGLVLIAAPARMQGETRGTVGVIGPKRMQYEQTMSAVMYMARVFDRMLEAGS